MGGGDGVHGVRGGVVVGGTRPQRPRPGINQVTSYYYT